jgi:hypothetical protein
MKPSVNGGGNNPGWVIVAPYDWKIAYVNSGNNNQSDSFVATNESGQINFNISGFHKGSADDKPALGSITVIDDFLEEFYNEYHKPVYKRIGANDTVILRDGTPLKGAENNRSHFGYAQIAEKGTLALAVGSKKNYINVDVNYAIVGGELKLWFDEERYGNISTGGIIAVVSDKMIDNDSAMKPGHAKIGIGYANAATALKAYSPNGNMNHKNAVTWLNGAVKPGNFLFVHIEGLQVDDLNDVVGCKLDYTSDKDTRGYIGEVTVCVFISDSEGNPVDGFEQECFDVETEFTYEFEGFVPGDYTVDLVVNGILKGTKVVVVEADGTAVADFGDVIVNEGNPVVDVYCCWCGDYYCAVPCFCDRIKQ